MVEVLGWEWKAVKGSKLALLPLGLCPTRLCVPRIIC